ncbi:carboxymuconolactone decarboxylase family protein [Orrella sp. JC864]|uniref:carboxymuconolactone decarboxylase family protein n=1 Tax=Orrella sp. JC864 TaxID=3120298 RepID=UPI0012BB795C
MQDDKPFDPVTPETVALGHKNRRATLGDKYVDQSIARAQQDDFFAPLQEAVTGLAWGAIWGRPGLTAKERSLITVSVLIATGRRHELALHLNGALNNGWTRKQVQEILLHAACYCGMPAAVDGFRIAKEVLDERAQSGQ